MSKVMTPLLRLLSVLAIATLACNGLGGTQPVTVPTPTPAGVAATATPTEALPTETLPPTAAPTAATPEVISAVPSGLTEITGQFKYTNDIITTYYVEQAVALVDMYGFVKRDQNWLIPVKSQTLGFLQLDPTNKTGSYWLELPAKPDGQVVDVSHGSARGMGVQIFAVSYWPNLAGGPYSEGDDPSRGWPNYLASVQVDGTNNDEVIGGKLVVWAPDNLEQFPTDFGPDGLLFTADDPVAPLPAGYSIVDLDKKPFEISQPANPQLALYEPQDAAIKDFSKQSYTQAFESLFKAMSTQWAFNGVPSKQVNWQALHDQIAPRVAKAEADKNPTAYYQALHTFIQSVPDGHTYLAGGQMASQEFQQLTAGGFGFAQREMDDGTVIAVFVLKGGPADKAGMQVGAQITTFNGKPISDAIAAVAPYSGPFSTALAKRYQQARYLLVGAVGAKATVTFVNPKGTPKTADLVAIQEHQSFNFTSVHRGENPNALPVESQILDTGAGYIKVNTNYDDLNLIIRLFQRALQTFQANQVTGLIVDLRHNSGGSPLGLAGFLYNQPIVLGQQEYYNDKAGKFQPQGVPETLYPNVEQYKFDKIAVLVGQACASACELEAYGFSKVPGAAVVGMYPSAGVEADVLRGQFLLPEGMSGQFPTERFVNPDGSVFLEGTGVQPTLRVPITPENVLSADDVELKAAEQAVAGAPSSASGGGSGASGAPVVGTQAETQNALANSVKFIRDLAPEQYTDKELSQAGHIYTYTVALTQETPLLWDDGWCAKDQATLTDNLSHIKRTFSINGQAVDPSTFDHWQGTATGMMCSLDTALVSQWPHGTTELDVAVTFDAKINDGQSDYPAGTHTYKYLVTLP
jgi:C-terminal processing protease CtpA/Prc